LLAPQINAAQAMSEAALFKYQPDKYDGNVLLLLAAERPTHVNFQPGWQAVITSELQVQYLDAHHRDLAKAKNVRTVAEAIASHLVLAAEDKPLSPLLEIPDHLLCHK
jgi:thioesterase domain-containing protein